MKQYYLKNGNKISGPFLLDDLKYQRINQSTQIRIDDGPWQSMADNKDFNFLNQNIEDDFENKSNEHASAVDANQSNQKVNSKIILMVVIAAGLVVMAMGIAAFVFFQGS